MAPRPAQCSYQLCLSCLNAKQADRHYVTQCLEVLIWDLRRNTESLRCTELAQARRGHTLLRGWMRQQHLALAQQEGWPCFQVPSCQLAALPEASG